MRPLTWRQGQLLLLQKAHTILIKVSNFLMALGPILYLQQVWLQQQEHPLFFVDTPVKRKTGSGKEERTT